VIIGMVQVELGLLALILAGAIHARVRVVPTLSDDTLPTLAWHVRAVTVETWSSIRRRGARVPTAASNLL
jgi:hypothetical protein